MDHENRLDEIVDKLHDRVVTLEKKEAVAIAVAKSRVIWIGFLGVAFGIAIGVVTLRGIPDGVSRAIEKADVKQVVRMEIEEANIKQKIANEVGNAGIRGKVTALIDEADIRSQVEKEIAAADLPAKVQIAVSNANLPQKVREAIRAEEINKRVAAEIEIANIPQRVVSTINKSDIQGQINTAIVNANIGKKVSEEVEKANIRKLVTQAIDNADIVGKVDAEAARQVEPTVLSITTKKAPEIVDAYIRMNTDKSYLATIADYREQAKADAERAKSARKDAEETLGKLEANGSAVLARMKVVDGSLVIDGPTKVIGPMTVADEDGQISTLRPTGLYIKIGKEGYVQLGTYKDKTFGLLGRASNGKDVIGLFDSDEKTVLRLGVTSAPDRSVRLTRSRAGESKLVLNGSGEASTVVQQKGANGYVTMRDFNGIDRVRLESISKGHSEIILDVPTTGGLDWRRKVLWNGSFDNLGP